MGQFGYLAMLAFTILGSWWLEWFFKLRVLRSLKFTLTTIAPVALFFLFWDWYAIRADHWNFDFSQMLAIVGPFNIPLEEYLFFIVIPLAVLLTFEGVVKLWPNLRDDQQEQK
jgi:lycopene cyclase domain-containing protein